jgi:predicted ABC-type ATPase
LKTTLATKFYANWMQTLKENGYNVHLIFLWLNSVELAIKRVRERVMNGGHDVPEETIRRRFDRGISNFFHSYLPIADSWQFFDASTTSPVELAIGDKIDGIAIFDQELWRQIEK